MSSALGGFGEESLLLTYVWGHVQQRSDLRAPRDMRGMGKISFNVDKKTWMMGIRLSNQELRTGA